MRKSSLTLAVSLIAALGCGKSEDGAQTGAAPEPTSGTESTQSIEGSAGSHAPTLNSGAGADSTGVGETGVRAEETAEPPKIDDKVRNTGVVNAPPAAGL